MGFNLGFKGLILHSNRNMLSTIFCLSNKVKVMVTLEQAMKAQRESRSIALLLL